MPDPASRLIGGWLSQQLGQPFVVENRDGASGNIATETVVNAAPDGYTLLTVASANTINPALYHDLNFNFVRKLPGRRIAARAARAAGQSILSR